MSEMAEKVAFLNPKTCGIYKNGAPRYRTDPSTGVRTGEIDNELMEAVDRYLAGKRSEDVSHVSLRGVFAKRILVPAYYDRRFDAGVKRLLGRLGAGRVTIGKLLDSGIIGVRGGHGSPGNDQRNGYIPYIKVSDVRGLRVNVNPTNLVPRSVAERYWGGADSGLKAWDVLTPNRASSNIGEFAILLPGEERIVVTKEVFVLRVLDGRVWDPFYLLWALSLRPIREQWRRIALMQTNREDCGERYREVVLPEPPDEKWARTKGEAFREYFETIAGARRRFVNTVGNDGLDYVANVGGRAEEKDRTEGPGGVS